MVNVVRGSTCDIALYKNLLLRWVYVMLTHLFTYSINSGQCTYMLERCSLYSTFACRYVNNYRMCFWVYLPGMCLSHDEYTLCHILRRTKKQKQLTHGCSGYTKSVLNNHCCSFSVQVRIRSISACVHYTFPGDILYQGSITYNHKKNI